MASSTRSASRTFPPRQAPEARGAGGGERLSAQSGFDGELVEARVTVEPTAATRVVLDLRGVEVVYDAKRERLRCADEDVYWPLGEDGRLDLRLFLDRKGLECFSADGLNCWPFRRAEPDARNRRLAARAEGARSAKFVAWKLRSIWLQD